MRIQPKFDFRDYGYGRIDVTLSSAPGVLVRIHQWRGKATVCFMTESLEDEDKEIVGDIEKCASLPEAMQRACNVLLQSRL
ncbi:hypothetical protein CPT_Percy8 [Caulobacter phage Percy]|uniref:Uncharacterized protein n=1 Tax=Caulobacter phage Percy TaxID=1701809 RepID=A0A0M4RSM3_9CAUD|nr:hypothetical protein CPT_Percy8 [Caulobacter phage Percy]ALF01642.1 hypothetical protein CPT_Percy8 [Caulobacter phage Percy]